MDLAFTAEEEAFAAEIREWLASQPRAPRSRADDESSGVGRWQAKLAADRWVGIHWPTEYGGRSATPVQVALYNLEYARSRAPQPVNRVGINLAGPTLLAHGTDEQKSRWLPPILDASELWCQLFSEPGAGSDLASLATPSGAGRRRLAALRPEGVDVVRPLTPAGASASPAPTPTRPSTRASRYLVVDMQSPGIEVRPLRQITGEAEFNEVFLDEVFVPGDHLVGGLNDGWAVANTTLAHERGTSFPFKEQVVHEVVSRRAVSPRRRAATSSTTSMSPTAWPQAFIELRVLRLHNWRTLSRLGAGHRARPRVEPRQARVDRHDPAPLRRRPRRASARAHRSTGQWQRQWLWSKASSIAGGTSEIQRTIIGDRLLGLPRG